MKPLLGLWRLGKPVPLEDRGGRRSVQGCCTPAEGNALLLNMVLLWEQVGDSSQQVPRAARGTWCSHTGAFAPVSAPK